MHTNKTCLECDFPIKGRSDKKFCSDSCRSAHHNQLRGPAENHIRKTNIILRKNRKILFDLYKREGYCIDRRKLLEAGFRFLYSTGIEINETGGIKRICYDISYQEIKEMQYQIKLIK